MMLSVAPPLILIAQVPYQTHHAKCRCHQVGRVKVRHIYLMIVKMAIVSKCRAPQELIGHLIVMAFVNQQHHHHRLVQITHIHLAVPPVDQSDPNTAHLKLYISS